jgi:hypothetical protein
VPLGLCLRVVELKEEIARQLANANDDGAGAAR